MKIICPKCERHSITLSDKECPGCNFSFAVGNVIGFYRKRLASRWHHAVTVRCPNPNCRKDVPWSETSCPHCHGPCGAGASLNGAAKETTNPIRSAYRQHFDQPTPEFIKRLQWSYLALSIVLLLGMFATPEAPNLLEWGRTAVVSVVFLAFIVLLFAWLVPRAKKTRKPLSIIVRFAFVFNTLAFVMALQMAVRNYWEQSVRLTGVLLMILGAVMLLYRFLWPMKKEFQETLNKQNDAEAFDHLKPQGRKGAHD